MAFTTAFTALTGNPVPLSPALAAPPAGEHGPPHQDQQQCQGAEGFEQEEPHGGSEGVWVVVAGRGAVILRQPGEAPTRMTPPDTSATLAPDEAQARRPDPADPPARRPAG